MDEMKPSISRARKFSAVWIIPLATLVAGGWIVIHSIITAGPTITLDFATADGLEAGKTKVKLLSVEVGLVENVTLKEDMSGVTTTVKLEPVTKPLLRDDTRFWIVRARIGSSGVSGLGTILGGSYIEMAPGTGTKERHEFVGLENPPLTPADAPGLRLRLFSERAGSVSTGDAVLYNGYKVGRVEAMTFDPERRQVIYDIFIDAPFHDLVNSSTRFWDTSGILLNASAEGVELRTGSLDTLLLGGIAFGVPPGLPRGSPVETGREYKLYQSYQDTLENPYRHGVYYVVMFRQSLRGLVPGAPVEYHGIQLGRVERLLVKELAASGFTGAGGAIPVLIYLEPGRLELPDNSDSVDKLKYAVEQGITKNGLRATLETGNLITGKQLISVDFFPDEEPAELAQFKQYTVIPSIETGVARLEQQVSAVLEKLNALPLEETLAEANDTLASLTAAIDSANSLLADNSMQQLPADLASTLAELRTVLAGLSPDANMAQSLGASINTLNTTLESLDILIRKLSLKPNSILFPPSPESDPIPEAYSR